MDDDIRSRFRGVNSRRTNFDYSPRPTRPLPERPRPAEPPRAPREVSEEFFDEAPPPPKQPKSKKPKKKKGFFRKLLTFLFILILLGGASAGGYFGYKRYVKKPVQQNQNQTATQTQTDQPKPTGTIRFIAVGDTSGYDSITAAAKKADGSYDYLPMMQAMQPFFGKADIRYCNQASPTLNSQPTAGYPNFNAPTALAKGLEDLGCNVINLGNDHINDKGQDGINASVAYWDNHPNVLAVAGANRTTDEQNNIRYFTVKQVKFAFLSYTTSSNNKQVSPFGVNMYSDDLAQKQLADAQKNAQMVIVSMNWGTENSGDITADQDRIAQKLADFNADVVLGNGPHVLQPAKILNGKNGHQSLVWFSLGNFLNSQLPIENLIGGMAVMDIDVATQHITNPELLPVYMHYEWTAQQKAAGTVNARHGFSLYPLDLAGDALAKSQNGTTVAAQTSRVTSIITKFAPIKVIKSSDF